MIFFSYNMNYELWIIYASRTAKCHKLRHKNNYQQSKMNAQKMYTHTTYIIEWQRRMKYNEKKNIFHFSKNQKFQEFKETIDNRSIELLKRFQLHLIRKLFIDWMKYRETKKIWMNSKHFVCCKKIPKSVKRGEAEVEKP